MDINPQWITLAFACNGMIAAIAGLFMNVRVCEDPVQRECAVGQPSQKWIETMRDLVASLNSQLLAAAAVRQLVEEPTGVVIAGDPELLRRVDAIRR